MDVDAGDAFARPGAGDRRGEEPATVALTGKRGDEADERKLTCAGRALIEFEQSDLLARCVNRNQQ